MMCTVFLRIVCECIVAIEREGVRKRCRDLNDRYAWKNTQNHKQLLVQQCEHAHFRSSLRLESIGQQYQLFWTYFWFRVQPIRTLIASDQALLVSGISKHLSYLLYLHYHVSLLASGEIELKRTMSPSAFNNSVNNRYTLRLLETFVLLTFKSHIVPICWPNDFQ